MGNWKIENTGEQVAQCDFQNKGRCIVLEFPLCNLLTSVCNFVPCDRVLQRAYSGLHNIRILKKEDRDMDHQRRSPLGGFRGNLHWKIFKNEVLVNGICRVSVLQTSVNFIRNT